jgi:hypothetical protein
MNSPFQLFDFSKLILPHLGNVLPTILAVSAIFVALTATVLFYHWWRYADSITITTITVGSYVAESILLLAVMFGSL